ncbi:hypothetical protein OS493_017591 [Desmophyllum pertusum]|uniref:Uncharacterized protein n=1 Tax=Desmophyllum pertusum TaxID=174260 RepID=A0A9X0D2W0_9CNID|nr:hypothetical protein OS493_017591 [Desmophyllum pertusum]
MARPSPGSSWRSVCGIITYSKDGRSPFHGDYRACTIQTSVNNYIGNQSPGKQDSTLKGVNYFKQFPRNFLVPYGASLDPTDDQKLLRYLQPFNCELLLRPSVFLSEFSSSVTHCSQALRDEMDSEHGFLQGANNMLSFVEYSEMLRDRLIPFSRDNVEVPNRNDVISFLGAIATTENDYQELIHKAFQLGNAFFSIASHCIASQILLRNPMVFAQKVSSPNGADLEFKRNPTVPSMANFISNDCLKHTSLASTADRQQITTDFTRLLQEEGVELPPSPRRPPASPVGCTINPGRTPCSSPLTSQPCSPARASPKPSTSAVSATISRPLALPSKQTTKDSSSSEESSPSPPASQMKKKAKVPRTSPEKTIPPVTQAKRKIFQEAKESDLFGPNDFKRGDAQKTKKHKKSK